MSGDKSNDIELDLEESNLGPPEEAISSLPSFYGAQLTSHANMIVGFLVALFALIQVRPTLNALTFDIVSFAVITGVVYSILRLALYGYVSSVLMNVSNAKYPGFKKSRQKFALSHYGLANAYVSYTSGNTLRAKFFAPLRNYRVETRVKDENRVKARYAIQLPAIVAVSLAILLTTVLFGSPPGWSLVVFTIGVAIFVNDTLAMFVDKPPRD